MDRAIASKIYLDQKSFVACTTHEGNHQGGTTTVNAQGGQILQEGPTETTYTFQASLVRGDASYKLLREKKSRKELVRVTRGTLGTFVESVQCTIETLSDAASHADGGMTFSGTLRAFGDVAIV